MVKAGAAMVALATVAAVFGPWLVAADPAHQELALRLGIPMYGSDPKCFHLGTKSGARRVFAEEGVSHPLGVEDLFTMDAMADAICAMRRQKNTITRVVAKLNEGVSGAGNANVDLTGLPAPGDSTERAAVVERLRQMKYESPAMTMRPGSMPDDNRKFQAA